MIDPFFARMSKLDGIVEQCRGVGAFAGALIRDTSNRSNRDWPWWGVQIERTRVDGAAKRRVAAEVTLNGPTEGVPSVFKATWTARAWYNESPDDFRQTGSRPVTWNEPSASDLEEVMAALLADAEAAIVQATGDNISANS